MDAYPVGAVPGNAGAVAYMDVGEEREQERKLCRGLGRGSKSRGV